MAKKNKQKTRLKLNETLNSQLDAINLVKTIIDTNNIKCNLEKVDSYVFNKSKENTSAMSIISIMILRLKPLTS